MSRTIGNIKQGNNYILEKYQAKILNNPKGKPVLLTLLHKLISNCLKHIVAPQ